MFSCSKLLLFSSKFANCFLVKFTRLANKTMLAFVENWFLHYDKETAFFSGIFVRRKEKTFTCEPLMLYTGLIKLDSYSIPNLAIRSVS